MDVTDFEAERARLFAIATRILGSEADADDVLQDARLRLTRADGIDDLPAWLTTVVTRLCLDQLRKRRSRSEAETDAGTDRTVIERVVIDPEADAVLAARVGGAMQVVLDVLGPAERAAFVLHDVFGYPFDDVGLVLGRSSTAVRQMASRARRKLQGLPEPTERAENSRVVEAFLAAARGGDLATLVSLLAPGAVMHADLVAQRMGTQARYDGADAVADRFNGAQGALPVRIDGDLAAAWIAAGDVQVAFVFHVDGGRVQEVELIADPEVLATMDVVRTRRRRDITD